MEHNTLGLTNLELGHATVDAEHGVQVKLVEALQRELRTGTREAAADLLVQLLGFSDAHFASEELLMRRHAYPRYHAHVEEHRRLLAHLRELSGHVTTGQDGSALVDELKRWLAGHIASFDRDFAEFARTGAVGEPGPAPGGPGGA